MKRVIKASYYPRYSPDEWDESDIELHNSIDWKSRNYNDYPVKSDSFNAKVVKYGGNDSPEYKTVKFVKFLRSNPIYPPYYAPEVAPFDDVVGPMYDGNYHGKYMIHDRYDTQEVYDMLSR